MHRSLALLALLAHSLGGCFVFPLLIATGGAQRERSTPIGEPAAVHGAIALGLAASDATWAPADELPYLALDADGQLGEGPLWLTSFYGIGYSDDVPTASPRGQGSTTTFDFGIGVRHYRALGPIEPFVGIGGAFVDRSFTYTDPEPGNLYDYSVGIYLEAGVQCAVAENFALGLLARRYLGDDQSIAAHDFEADYSTFAVMLTFRR